MQEGLQAIEAAEDPISDSQAPKVDKRDIHTSANKRLKHQKANHEAKLTNLNKAPSDDEAVPLTEKKDISTIKNKILSLIKLTNKAPGGSKSAPTIAKKGKAVSTIGKKEKSAPAIEKKEKVVFTTERKDKSAPAIEKKEKAVSTTGRKEKSTPAIEKKEKVVGTNEKEGIPISKNENLPYQKAIFDVKAKETSDTGFMKAKSRDLKSSEWNCRSSKILITVKARKD